MSKFAQHTTLQSACAALIATDRVYARITLIEGGERLIPITKKAARDSFESVAEEYFDSLPVFANAYGDLIIG